MFTVALGVVAFTAIVLSLVLVLLAAKARLVSSDAVSIVINDDPENTLSVDSGGTLLATLAEHDLFIPSACGGKGTCGVCKVTVNEGGGGLLPTETAHISPAEARLGRRLACQVKLRRDVKIELPEEIFNIRSYPCRVRSNDNVASFIKELVLQLPDGQPLPFRAGDYIQLHVPPHSIRFSDFDVPDELRDDWDKFDFWRLSSTVSDETHRAYSMANRPDDDGMLVLNVRIATPPPDVPNAPPGQASSYVFSLRAGDEVDVSGPYGEFHANESDAEMVFIGGGAGMAPLRSILLDEFRRLHTRRKVSYWYGARSLREAFYVEDFAALAVSNDNFDWHLALSEPLPEDDWTGDTGFIHQVVYDRYLANHPAPEELEYYLCGPPPMIRACLTMLDDLGVDSNNIRYDEF